MKRQEMAFDPFQLIDKKDRKQLTRRSDWMGLAYLVGHFTAIGAGGRRGLPDVRHDPHAAGDAGARRRARLPVRTDACECSHGTAFRTRALNEAAYWLVSLVYISQPTWYRYRHAVHHTYTRSRARTRPWCCRGRRPGSTISSNCSAGASGPPFRSRSPSMRSAACASRTRYVPKRRSSRIYNEARIMIACYAGVASVAIWFGSFAPLVYWLLPRMMGEPPQRAWRIAEHKGCDEGTDVRTNTRSTKAGPLMRALCWNMPITPSTMSFRRRRSSRCLRSTSLGSKLKLMGESAVGGGQGSARTCIGRRGGGAHHRQPHQPKEIVDKEWLCALD